MWVLIKAMPCWPDKQSNQKMFNNSGSQRQRWHAALNACLYDLHRIFSMSVSDVWIGYLSETITSVSVVNIIIASSFCLDLHICCVFKIEYKIIRLARISFHFPFNHTFPSSSLSLRKNAFAIEAVDSQLNGFNCNLLAESHLKWDSCLSARSAQCAAWMCVNLWNILKIAAT